MFRIHSNTPIPLFLFSILLIFSSICFGQNEIYKNYTVKDGLPSNTVYKAFQDSKGFIWFSTDAGVSRFDGLTFENFSMDDGLSDNEVFQIKEDSKGRIWFLTFNGKISYFFNEKIYNQENDTIIRKLKCSGYLSSLFEDSKHNIWIGRSSKYASQIKYDNTILEYTLPMIQDTQISEPCFFERENMKCLTRYAILEVIDNTIIASHKKVKSRLLYNFAPFYYTANEIYFYSDYGIERIINGEREIVIQPYQIKDLQNLLSITVTKERDIWLTTLNDKTILFKYEKGIFKGKV